MEHYTELGFSRITTAPGESPTKGLEKIYKSLPQIKEENFTYLSELSLVNLFVGSNNSGKSRFLRSLFYADTFEFKTIRYDPTWYITQLENFEKDLQLQLQQIRALHQPGTGNLLASIPILASFYATLKKTHLTHENIGFIDKSLFELAKYIKDQNQIQNLARALQINHGGIPSFLQIAFNNLNVALISKDIKHNMKNREIPLRHVYVPVLRGLRCADNADYFSEKTFADYFRSDGKTNLPLNKNIFNGFKIYETLTTGLLNSSTTRKMVMEYEDFLSEELFEGEKVQISPKQDSQKTVSIKIGGKDDLPIYSLGDGVQSLIILTFDAFFSEENSLYFVEEPEIYLHPGMQRKLIDLLINHPKMKKHQWFFTTHSNHLLDLTLDFDKISVFGFRSVDSGYEIERKSSGDHNTLKLLGVNGSSVFRTNSIIWIEGVTDRHYLKTYFDKYLSKHAEKRKLKQDVHYSFVEFSGGNITHFDYSDFKSDDNKIFVNRIVGHSFILLDGDNAEKGTRAADLKALFTDERFFLFKAKEIENTLPQQVLKYCVDKRLKASLILKDYHESITPKIEQILESEYSIAETPIGTYLDKKLDLPVLLKKIETNKDRYFAEKSGTLTDKVTFCETAIKWMVDNTDSWDLSPEVESLCEKLYTFILKANP